MGRSFLTAGKDKSVHFKGVTYTHGMEILPNALGPDELTKLTAEGWIISTETPDPPPEPTPVPVGSKWNFNPKDLAGKSIAQLNALVLERDPAVKPFETTEEAIAFLSAEYGLTNKKS